MAQTQMNADGLFIKFGPDKATAAKAGEYRTVGAMREIEVKIDLTTLASSPTIIDDNTQIPAGYRIQEVIVIGETAATSSGSGTIDIGIQKLDRSTEYDYDGLVAAMVKGSVDTTGENNSLVVGSTYAGALIGATTAYTGYITANYNTAVYQTGVIKVRIRMYKP